MLDRCGATNKAGERCGAKALPGSDRCFAHDPNRIVDIAEARRKGGRAKSNRARARRELSSAAMTPSEINGILALTLRQVFGGTKTPGVGQAVAALCRVALEAGKTADLEQQIAELRQRIEGRAS